MITMPVTVSSYFILNDSDYDDYQLKYAIEDLLKDDRLIDFPIKFKKHTELLKLHIENIEIKSDVEFNFYYRFNRENINLEFIVIQIKGDRNGRDQS